MVKTSTIAWIGALTGIITGDELAIDRLKEEKATMVSPSAIEKIVIQDGDKKEGGNKLYVIDKAGQTNTLYETSRGTYVTQQTKGQSERTSQEDLSGKLGTNYTAKVRGTMTLIGLLGGAFFLSSNITGNAIGSLSNTATSYWGIGLLLVGLLYAFLWVKGKRDKKKFRRMEVKVVRKRKKK